MTAFQPINNSGPHVIIIGAGLGGLSAAMVLAATGARVTVLERAATTGGKVRAFQSAAGPVDAGPTVLTMRHVFDDLFRRCGASLNDHLTLVKEPLLARHWWPDGSTLDLFSDQAESTAAINRFAGSKAAREFEKFASSAKTLFDAFQAPVMEAAAPSYPAMIRHVMRRPSLAPLIAPHKTLAKRLNRAFTDPRLRQLFGRYATYVGGSPLTSPAILSLIWHAEAAGVWRVEGGMRKLVEAMTDQLIRLGGEVICDCDVNAIDPTLGIVRTAGGAEFRADSVLYAGDPAALRAGLLGDKSRDAVTSDAVAPRSLSANVWAFAAEASGPDLVHHNVFFAHQPNSEFSAIAAGKAPDDPTIYICAQDRSAGAAPAKLERFEAILNAAPTQTTTAPTIEERQACQTRMLATLGRFGLTFSPAPGVSALTTPQEFANLFPGSAGSLYGLSPQDLNATFKRPTARSRIKGLYLAGGGVHPGPGAPMATLSGLRAAEAIANDLTLTSTSRPMVMRGGT